MRKSLEIRIDEILRRAGARDEDVQIALANQPVMRPATHGGTRPVMRTVHYVEVDG